MTSEQCPFHGEKDNNMTGLPMLEYGRYMKIIHNLRPRLGDSLSSHAQKFYILLAGGLYDMS